MIDLRNRSTKKELLDQDDIPFEDIKRNMQELNTINTMLGGHSITLRGFKSFTNDKRFSQPFIIAEIGCGGGDNLMMIRNWCIKNNISASFIGIDMKQECIDFCKEKYNYQNVEWFSCEYHSTPFINKPSVIFSSLFCHHFSNAEIQEMLHWMKDNSTLGFFINDLHRHPLAYYSIKWITKIFSKSYLVKNDAPLSVARGFTAGEWEYIFTTANLKAFSINWKWAFRYLIIYKSADDK